MEPVDAGGAIGSMIYSVDKPQLPATVHLELSVEEFKIMELSVGGLEYNKLNNTDLSLATLNDMYTTCCEINRWLAKIGE